MKSDFDPALDPAWSLVTRGYDPLRESSIESRFTVSNGFLGVRGGRAVTRAARWIVSPSTYIAGLFDTPVEQPFPVLIPAVGWLQVRVSVPGKPLAHHPFDVPSHLMTLDMRRGLVLTQWCHRQAQEVSMRVHTLRLASLSERSVGLQTIRMEIEEGETEIVFEASFEGLNAGLLCERLGRDLGLWRTQYSGKRLAMATALSLKLDGVELPAAATGPLKYCWRWKCSPGQTACFERIAAFVRSDREADPRHKALEKVSAARGLGARGLIAAHEAAWAKRWRRSGVDIEGDELAQRALRFAIYHLNSAANPDDDRVSIGARALTGDDYHGHVFWDTEIYLLPFYIMTWPEAARGMLMYRYRTLDGARAKAAGMGWRGALYAWESADTGAEATPAEAVAPDRRVVPVLCGTQEQHISADVAYAVWHYWRATADDAFLCNAGAEIILETARFWASRATLEEDGRRHIRGVIGPDEYHEQIDDNAYTNVVARWNIRCGLRVASLLRERWPESWRRLAARIALEDGELDRWRSVADTIADNFNPETGLFEEFSGYFELEEIDLEKYACRSVPMDVVLGRERTGKSQIVKQPDVVALLALLPEEFPAGSAQTNFAFYEKRCSHGSSLSPSLHGLVAARLGQSELALQYLRRGAGIDLSDTHAGIAGGVHIGAQGGNWMLVVFGFAGLSLRDDGVSFEPKLPAGWRSLSFAIQWRGRRLKIRIDQENEILEASLAEGDAMTVEAGGARNEVRRDSVTKFSLGGPKQAGTREYGRHL